MSVKWLVRALGLDVPLAYKDVRAYVLESYIVPKGPEIHKSVPKGRNRQSVTKARNLYSPCLPAGIVSLCLRARHVLKLYFMQTSAPKGRMRA